MHGEAIAIAQTPVVAVSYLVLSGVFYARGKFALPGTQGSAPASEPPPAHAEEAAPVPAE